MSINLEIILPIAVELIMLGTFGGWIKANITNLSLNLIDNREALKEDISRLEQKQDKHNGLIERMVVVEQSTKSAHYRIDHVEKEK